MNTFGNLFRLTSFGESHGKAIGGVIDGCPAGLEIDTTFIQHELNRRRPGQSSLTTPRRESDTVQFLSGIFEGKTTGAPIAFIIPNENAQSEDYENLKEIFRPSHADYTYFKKYGIRDYRGGGRSSARETASRVVAGAIAKLYLQKASIRITAYTSQVGNIQLANNYKQYDFAQIEKNDVRCPDAETAEAMSRLIHEVKTQGDTIGGVVTCVIQNPPIGLGEPVFGKLHAALGAAMLSINAVKGFEYGSGFEVSQRGSQLNDAFINDNEKIRTQYNHSGGIQGGISNGEDIYFRIAFKPVSTLLMEQQTVDKSGNTTMLTASGRHDACVLPRAVPIVEAMAAMVMMDYMLLANATQNKSHNLSCI